MSHKERKEHKEKMVHGIESTVPSGRKNSVGISPDTGVSGLYPMSLRDTSLYSLQTSKNRFVACVVSG
jgi:hypothetical protein